MESIMPEIAPAVRLPSAEGLTNEQMQAVYAENPRLLVSAAAGSGKTKVLIERILHLVAMGKIKLNRMLIVTFTRAAAGEMRSRLESGLAAACELTNLPDEMQKNLREGSLTVRQAQISTIDSFCQKVVKQHFDYAQVDPQFSILDSRTREQIMEESMEEALEALYECADSDADSESKPWAQALSERFNRREITEMLLKLYEFIIARPDPESWLQAQINRNPSLGEDQNSIEKIYMRDKTEQLQKCLGEITRLQAFTAVHALPDKYEGILCADRVIVEDLLRAASEGMTALSTKLHNNLKWDRKPPNSPSSEDEERAEEHFKETREAYKKIVKDLYESTGAEGIWADLSANVPVVNGLCFAMLQFLRIFREQKQELAQIDFSDVEHSALRILRDDERCTAIRAGYDAVFVDECQDISRLQEELLTRLCPEGGETSIFYVGDVKQSIYRFRQACPELFLHKLKTFSLQPDAASRAICLNENFRSRDEVIGMVNRVFLHLMKPELTEIDYRDNQQLFAAPGAEGGPCAEVHVLYDHGMKAEECCKAEAKFIVEDICRRLRNGETLPAYKGQPERPLTPGDIAILAPSITRIRPLLEKAFAEAEQKLEIKSMKNEDALESMEVQLALQFLSLLCNAHNDTAVATVLRSPLFAFTDEELAQIRLQKKESCPFYEAVRAACESADEPLRTKLCCALSVLQDERQTMLAMSVGAYLWDFLRRSGLFALAGAIGSERQTNLCAFCESAFEFDERIGGSMQDFVDQMLANRKADSDLTPSVADEGNAVRLLTIHGSKGLQFPVVYCMQMCDTISKREDASILQQDEERGIDLEYRDPDLRIKRKTVLYNCIHQTELYANRAERARVLYVAMTRAEQKLILCGTDNSKFDPMDYLDHCFTSRENEDDCVMSAKNYMDWILDCVRPDDDIFAETADGWTQDMKTFGPDAPNAILPATPLQWRVVFHEAGLYADAQQQEQNEVEPVPQEALLGGEAFLEADAPDVLPRSVANEKENALRRQAMPQKVGVTALCAAMRQEEAQTIRKLNEQTMPQTDDVFAPDALEETAETKRNPTPKRTGSITDIPVQPVFLAGKEPCNPATERGVQTHRTLSLIDLEKLRQMGDDPIAISRAVEEECRRIREEILLEEERPYLDERMVQRFYADDIAKRMLRSPEVHREWRFAMHMTEPFETVLQGVVDLCFLEEDEWVLVDYKTDRVENAEDLWIEYGQQLEYYKEALESLTGHRVRQMALFSLRLGVCCFKK